MNIKDIEPIGTEKEAWLWLEKFYRDKECLEFEYLEVEDDSEYILGTKGICVILDGLETHEIISKDLEIAIRNKIIIDLDKNPGSSYLFNRYDTESRANYCRDHATKLNDWTTRKGSE